MVATEITSTIKPMNSLGTIDVCSELHTITIIVDASHNRPLQDHSKATRYGFSRGMNFCDCEKTAYDAFLSTLSRPLCIPLMSGLFMIGLYWVDRFTLDDFVF
jgi:hypothetical protein